MVVDKLLTWYESGFACVWGSCCMCLLDTEEVEELAAAELTTEEEDDDDDAAAKAAASLASLSLTLGGANATFGW